MRHPRRLKWDLTQERQMSEEGQGQGENKGTEGTGEESKPELKSFTDDQLKSMMSREKKEGRQAAEKAIAEELGKPIAEVKALLKAAEEREEAEKTELQKAIDENERIKRESSETASAAARDAHDTRVRLELVRAGVPLPEDPAEADQALDRLARLVTAEVGASVDDIRENIGGAKKQFPQLFEASSTQGGTPGSLPSGTPTRKPALGESASDKAKRLAEESNRQRGYAPTA
jgi:hypothetical protein